MTAEPEQRPNSRKGIPNGSSKHYGDRDERFTLDIDPEEAMKKLVDDQNPGSESGGGT